MSSMYIRWLVFPRDLLNLYPAVHLLNIWLKFVVAITNNNVDSAFPWNIPLWIFASGKLFPPAVYWTFQVSMIFSIKLMRQVFIQLWRIILYHMPFLVNPSHSWTFPSLFYSCWGCIDQCRVALLCLWSICGMFSVPWGLLAHRKFLSLFVHLVFSTSYVGRLLVCNCLERFPFRGYFWINVIVPLVIHPGTSAPCRYLFISSASLLWRRWILFKTRIHVCHYGLSFSNFIFLVLFWVNRCVFSLSVLYRVLLTHFPMLLIHAGFLICSLGCHILLQNCLASLASGCWYLFSKSPPTSW